MRARATTLAVSLKLRVAIESFDVHMYRCLSTIHGMSQRHAIDITHRGGRCTTPSCASTSKPPSSILRLPPRHHPFLYRPFTQHRRAGLLFHPSHLDLDPDWHCHHLPPYPRPPHDPPCPVSLLSHHDQYHTGALYLNGKPIPFLSDRNSRYYDMVFQAHHCERSDPPPPLPSCTLPPHRTISNRGPLIQGFQRIAQASTVAQQCGQKAGTG